MAKKQHDLQGFWMQDRTEITLRSFELNLRHIRVTNSRYRDAPVSDAI